MPVYVAIDDTELDAESPVTVSLMTRLRDNALAYAGAPIGTRAMWQQTSAPLGWVKESLYHDFVPRVVTGSVGTGGSVNFSTLFGRTTTDSVTLSIANLPPHDHGGATASGGVDHTHAYVRSYNSNAPEWGPGDVVGSQNFGTYDSTTGNASAYAHAHNITVQGSGTAFSPTIDMRVKYIDTIIAQKD